LGVGDAEGTIDDLLAVWSTVDGIPDAAPPPEGVI